jgi:hypothetical protein
MQGTCSESRISAAMRYWTRFGMTTRQLFILMRTYFSISSRDLKLSGDGESWRMPYSGGLSSPTTQLQNIAPHGICPISLSAVV